MMETEYVRMTKGERECVKEQLLAFVKRVSADYNGKMPEEVEALPAIVQLLLDWH